MARLKKSAALTTASGTLASLQATYYGTGIIETLKANTPFGVWGWECACGQPVTKRIEALDSMGVCDGCHFRYQVMKAAGRLDEFEAAHKRPEPAITRKRPLPARTGKTIQMYNYLGKPRKKK
jgi:hypothetical protein